MFEYLRQLFRWQLMPAWWIFTYPVEVLAFALGLAVVAFTEIGRLVIAPTRIVVKDISFEKLRDDLHRSKDLLKQSRLVGGYTGKVPSFIPALFMTSLLVGIPSVAVLAKAAWLIHLTPFDGFTRKIPMLAPYIGTGPAALRTIFYTAIAAKLAKLPALIVATCCPQFEESWIHKNINVHLIHAFTVVGKWAARFTMERVRWARDAVYEMGARLNRVQPFVAVIGLASGLRILFSAAVSLLPSRSAAPLQPSGQTALLVPATSAPAPESEWKLEIRTAIHTLLTYGLAAFLPFLTYMALLSAYRFGKMATISLFQLVGVHGSQGIVMYIYVIIGLVFGFAAGAFVALGGLYGIASLAYSLFGHAAKGTCVLSERAEAAIAQSMHEALLLSLVPAFAMIEGVISVPFAAGITIAATGAMAYLGGWRPIHEKYRRINQEKIRTRPPVAQPANQKVGLDGFFVIP